MLSDTFAHARVEVFELSRLLESCDGDDELARDVLVDFLDTAPPLLARLAQAVAGGDAICARLEAHSLKGSAQTLGAGALAWVSLNMEEAAKHGEMAQAPLLLSRIEGEMRRVRPRLEEHLGGRPQELRRAA